MRGDGFVFLPLLALNAALLGAPAVWHGGVEAIAWGRVPVSLAILSVGMACELCAESADRVLRPHSRNEERAATILNAIQGLCVLAVMQAMLVTAATTSTAMTWLTPVGIFIMAGGVVLRCAAIRSLGRGFTDGFSPVEGIVVSRGPYRFLDHPAELGLLIIPLGLALVLGVCSLLPVTMPVLVVCAAMRIVSENVAIAASRRSAEGRNIEATAASWASSGW